MDKLLMIFYLLAAFTLSSAIQISNITVPEYVFIDTEQSVILDCDYEMGDNIDGLVVKWFLNDKMLYQWIYNKTPQSVGNLKDYIDLTYQATSVKETMYRALKIKELTLEMSGMYNCVVFTYAEEASESKNMIVVKRPASLDIAEIRADDTSSAIACSAIGVFPVPQLNITSTEGTEFDDINTIISKGDDGLYNVTQVVTMDAIKPDTTFLCSLTIEDTSYSQEAIYVYNSGSLTSTETDMNVDYDATTVTPDIEGNTAMLPSMYPWISLFLTAVATILLST
ncbi:uncharacterized protein CBL_11711 [Carabus blaptoides fortunei]